MMGVLLFVAFFLLGNLPDGLFFEMGGLLHTAGVKTWLWIVGFLLFTLIGFWGFTPYFIGRFLVRSGH